MCTYRGLDVLVTASEITVKKIAFFSIFVLCLLLIGKSEENHPPDIAKMKLRKTNRTEFFFNYYVFFCGSSFFFISQYSMVT